MTGANGSISAEVTTPRISKESESPVSITPEFLAARDAASEERATRYVICSVATPAFRRLLTWVLNTIDASIPNKDQNRAMKRTIREDFDTAYIAMHALAYPENSYKQSGDFYVLEPYPEKNESPLENMTFVNDNRPR